MDKKGRAVSFFITLIFFILGAAGMSEAYLSVMNTQIIRWIFETGLILVCVFLSLVYGKVICRRSGVLTGICAAVYIGVLWRFREKAVGGLAASVQAVLEQMNSHFKMNLVWQADQGVGPGDITFSLFMLFLPLIALLAWSFYNRRRLLAGLLFLLPVFVCLWTAGFCSMVSVLLMLVSFLGLAAGGRKNDPFFSSVKMTLCMTGICLVTVLMAEFLLKPVMDQVFDRSMVIGRRLQTALNEEMVPQLLSLGGGMGGSLVDGHLDREEGFEYTGTRVLEITLDKRPARDIYLKGFVGNVYTGNEWETDGDRRIREYYDERGWELPKDYAELMNLSFYAGRMYQEQGSAGQAGSKKEPDLIQVRRIAAPGRLGLYPYGAYLDDRLDVRGDGSLKGSRRKETYRFYPVLDYCFSNLEGKLDLGDYEEAEQHYRSYVYDTCRDFPGDRLVRMSRLLDNVEPGSVRQAMQFVQILLAQNAKYNLNAPACPEGADFAENFLYEQNEGYCVHFATTAVLLLRGMGYPARYVSGYLAPASTFQRQEDGSYRAVVEDRQAHAWAEVYLDGVGWYPFEASPGGIALEGTQRLSLDGGSNDKINSSSASQDKLPGVLDKEKEDGEHRKEADSQYESGEDKSAQEEKEQSSGGEINNGLRGWLIGKGASESAAAAMVAAVMWVMAVFSAACSVVLFICIRRELILMARNKKRCRMGRNERIAEAFRLMYRALLYAGLPQEMNPSSSDFIKKVEEMLPGLPQGELAGLMEDVVRSNFGEEELPMERVRSAEKLCEEVRRKLGMTMPRGKRAVYRLWKVFY